MSLACMKMNGYIPPSLYEFTAHEENLSLSRVFFITRVFFFFFFNSKSKIYLSLGGPIRYFRSGKNV